MKIIINLSHITPENKKHIINSIKGFTKSLAKRFGFEMEFEVKGE
jgi:hypothetical protein